MASFLRRFVEKSRSKSRSKSPTKRAPKPTYHAAADEFDTHWQPGFDQRPPMMPQQKMLPVIRTQALDERTEVTL